MLKRIICVILCMVLLFCSGYAAEEVTVPYSKEYFHIYINIGQSNASGRAPVEEQDMFTIPRAYLLNKDNKWEPAGPEKTSKGIEGFNRYSLIEKPSAYCGLNPAYYFAKTITENQPGIAVGIISNAIGGVKIEAWQKGAGTNYYESTLERAREAMKTGTIKGIIWHQGESNQAAKGYIELLEKMLNDFRKDLGIPDLPLVAGQILQPKDGSSSIFNETIIKIPNEIPNTACVISGGLTDQDGVHFDSESQRTLGKRYAEKFMELVYDKLNYKNEKLKSSVVLFVDNPKALIKNTNAMVDPANASVMPFVKNDRTLVPVRFIAESFGAQVSYEEATETVTVAFGDNTIKLVIGKAEMNVNGTVTTLDVTAETVNDRTFIPLRALVEAMGKNVFWDDRGLIIISDGELNTSSAEIDDLVLYFK